MIEIERLAHRGFWELPEQRNGFTAIERAFRCGFGIETDLRDSGGHVVISHDPPGSVDQQKENLMTLDDLFGLYRDTGATGTLALNIKSDGLASEVHRLVDQHGIENYFVFDMSIPDMLAYLKLGMRCFRRVSELEPWVDWSEAERAEPHQLSTCCGIWLDAFFSTWYSQQRIVDFLRSGSDVCLVSPELHGRSIEPIFGLLQQTLSLLAQQNHDPVGKLMVCTDVPDASFGFPANS